MAVAVVFPGQGSQMVGMGKDLQSFEDSFRLLQQADTALGYSLTSIMFEGPQEALRMTENTQPALLLHSIALWQLVCDKIKPDYFAGHSLGEYTALVAAGGLDPIEAARTVHNRGKFMQAAVPVGVGGMMAVLGGSDADVEAACQEATKPGSVVEPANYNSDGQIVVAGHLTAIERFEPIMKGKGAKRLVLLPVSAPFHCSLMEPARIEMVKYLESLEIRSLKTPVINNVDAALETEPQQIRDALGRQMSGAVKWSQSVKKLVELGVDTFIEIGAGSVLCGLIKKIDRSVTCINISETADIQKVQL